MNCPFCGARCGENDHYCSRCGGMLRTVPAPKKGSHLVPVLILLLLSLLGTAVFFLTRSGAPAESDTPWFQISDGYLYFDESLYTGSSELTVPAQIDGQTVLALGEGCFENCTGLTTVILPDTLEVIGPYAFAGCTALRGIYIPDSVRVIGSYAFYGCESLEAVTVPLVRRINPGAFEGCYQLDHVFYAGSYGDWVKLYTGPIGMQTIIYCKDGSFYHSDVPYLP